MTDAGLTAPELLAVAYAPRAIREEFRWLLAFDRKLRELVFRAREPLIAQLRMAWWRDALSKSASERPTGEPLLAALADDNGSLATAAVRMIDDYEALIGASESVGLQPLATAYESLPGNRQKSHRRPISILARARQLEQRGSRADGVRLVWHALTGW